MSNGITPMRTQSQFGLVSLPRKPESDTSAHAWQFLNPGDRTCAIRPTIRGYESPGTFQMLPMFIDKYIFN